MAEVMAEHRFPCDTCGTDMRFDPGADQLICDYCGNTEVIGGGSAHPIREQDFRAAIRAELPKADLEETRTVGCENCGATVEYDPTIHAADCPFCGTPFVADTGVSRHIKPRGVLPFALTEKQARDALKGWLGRLWFAPSGVQEYARKGQRLDGIYVPYWTFDADTKSSYAGQRGTVYYETKSVVRDGKRQNVRVAKVRWQSVSGRVARFFDDVLVLASRALPKRYTDGLAPWDLSPLEPYRVEYLAGFRAEAYSIELEDAFGEARGHMDRMIERDVRFDIGGDRQRIHNIDTQIANVTFKHVLLPVWLAAYKYRGKSFRFVVNGRTGKVQGERPYSPIKIAIAVVVGLVIAVIVGFVAAQQG